MQLIDNVTIAKNSYLQSIHNEHVQLQVDLALLLV